MICAVVRTDVYVDSLMAMASPNSSGKNLRSSAISTIGQMMQISSITNDLIVHRQFDQLSGIFCRKFKEQVSSMGIYSGSADPQFFGNINIYHFFSD
jgi:hypothetical protein